MKKKTKNKQDATMVNVRAAKKRESKLEKRIKELEKRIDTLEAVQEHLLAHTHC